MQERFGLCVVGDGLERRLEADGLFEQLLVERADGVGERGFDVAGQLRRGGALGGGASMGARGYRINRIVLINLMNFIVGVSFTLSGMLSPGAFALFAVLSCIEGIAGGIFNASFVAVVQTRIDCSVRGSWPIRSGSPRPSSSQDW